jgi:ubiquinone/menaquinone biosynthesis C-methylase UbiE
MNEHEAKNEVTSEIQLLLERANDQHRPTLENRVAYQFELDGDVLGHFSNSLKNRTTLEWLGNEITKCAQPASVLDIGCAYGNMMLMLNAWLNKRSNVTLVGVDLYADGLKYSQAFASQVEGYANCTYQSADLSKQLPFDEATFDAINLGDVIEHMENTQHAMNELKRVLKPNGIVIISTPLKGGVFKRCATAANKLTGGRLYREYYKGKSTELDTDGKPVMVTHAGHDHISEMTYYQIRDLLKETGMRIEKVQPMTVMSGSRWFDKHLFLISSLFFVEALHRIFGFKSWAHSVMILARKSN